MPTPVVNIWSDCFRFPNVNQVESFEVFKTDRGDVKQPRSLTSAWKWVLVL